MSLCQLFFLKTQDLRQHTYNIALQDTKNESLKKEII